MRNRRSFVLLAAALLVGASCSDTHTASLPTVPDAARAAPPSASAVKAPGTCTTASYLSYEIDLIVPAGGNRTSVHASVTSMIAAVNRKDYAGAQSLTYSIDKFLIQLYKSGGTTGTKAQAAKLMNDLLCYAGLATTITDPVNANVIFPTDPAEIITGLGGTAGVSLPGAAVSEPTIVQFFSIPDTFGGGGHGPLHTKLDQYAGFIDIQASSVTSAPLAKQVIVAVCPPPDLDPVIRARLRLGHDAVAGFEITPAADASFLTCSTSIGAAPSAMPTWLKALANAVLPKKAYARITMLAAGGVGGTAGEFSPFDAIDPDVSFSGGVGGTAGEFSISPRGPARLPTTPESAHSSLVPTSPSFTVVAGVCTDTAVVAGTPLEQQCSPAVSLHTYLGTKLIGIPVSWAITAGGGTVAPTPASPWSCGAFGSTASTTTDVNGEAHVCWTMGPTPGHNNNTVVATPSIGGDAPAGVIFVPASGTFTASGLRHTPTATATGANVQFDNLTHAGSGTCSDGLIPVLSYSNGAVPLAGPPKDPGSYTLTVTCGDGNVHYDTVTATAPIVITFGYSDGFETPSGWTATGLWHRSTLRTGLDPIVNSLYPNFVDLAPGDASGGALPSPFAGSWVFWYGGDATGNYIDVQSPSDAQHSGGTSTAPHSGTLTSPPIAVPATAGGAVVLRFNTWWEIESTNPSTFDIMALAVHDVAAGTTTSLGTLNPKSDPAGEHHSTPFTSAGYNLPPRWVEIAVDLSAYRGRTVQIIYSFDTQDVLYNGFRGLLIDNVRVGAEASAPASGSRVSGRAATTGATANALTFTPLAPLPAAGTRSPRP
ncbi:MAG: hypothetical protein ABI442_18670 [Gemmatimonadaceae bacterium]